MGERSAWSCADGRDWPWCGIVANRSYKRSLLGVGGILVLLAVGGFAVRNEGGGLWGIFGKGSEPAAAKPANATANATAKYDEDRSKRPKRSREDIQRLADRWYQEILEKHPEMRVSFKDVPDEKNGFLQLLNFIDRFGKYGADGLPMPDEIRAMIAGNAPWDAAAMAKWLEENRALFNEIVAIGLLKEQSAKGIDMDRLMFFGAKLPNECSRLLLANARLAMERGDEAGALESTRAAFGLADHMDRMEMPSLLSETISILIRQNVRKAILDQMVGANGGIAPDLAAWQELLAGGPETPADMAKIFLGEWHNTTRNFLLPGLLGDADSLPVLIDSSSGEASARQNPGVNDPDAVVEAHLRYFSRLMDQMKEAELGELPGLSAYAPDMGGVSENGAAVLDVVRVGASAWSKGWTRSQTDAAIYQAALQAASGGEIPLEPFTGKPFVIDREAGTVSVPEDPWFESMNYAPVKIPEVRGR